MINLSVSNEALLRAVSDLRSAQSKFPQAVARAVNRTMDGMRTDAVKETSKKYFVKAGEVRKSISFREASAGNLMGAMVSRGKRQSLSHYQITPKKPKNNARILGAVKREGGLKPLGDAFLVRVAGGKYTPVWRLGTEKWNVKYAISPSMPQIIKNEETVKAMQEGAERRFSLRMEHEINRILEVLS